MSHVYVCTYAGMAVGTILKCVYASKNAFFFVYVLITNVHVNACVFLACVNACYVRRLSKQRAVYQGQ